MCCVTGYAPQFANRNQYLDASHDRQKKQHRLRLPIAYKMALAITLCTFLSLMLLVSINSNQQYKLLKAQISGFATTIVNQLAAASQESLFTGNHLGLRLTFTNLTRQNDIRGVALYDEHGVLLLKEGETSGSLLAEKLRNTQPSPSLTAGEIPDKALLRFRWTSYQEQDLTAFIAPVSFQGITGGYVEVTFSQIQLFGVISNAITNTILVALILSALSSILAIVMGKRLSSPIVNLVDATEQALGQHRKIPRERRSGNEIAYLIDDVNEMGQAMLEKNQLEQVFSRFVSPSIASQMIDSLDDAVLNNRRVEATVLFADIVGFTQMSEKLDPAQVAELLNEYYGYCYKLSKYFYGTVDKFIGDAAMVVFGVPEDDPEHRFHAIAYAACLQQLMEQLNVKRRKKQQSTVHIRIGINCGMMQAGLLGTDERMEYTVVGDAVNLASRLSAEASADQIVIPAEIYHHEKAKDRLRAKVHGAIRIRGKSEPVDTYLVTEIVGSQQQAISDLLADLLNGTHSDD